MSDASIATRWKKGQSGNPHGRPKKPAALLDQSEMLEHFARLLLEQPCDVLGEGTQTRLTRLMLEVAKRAERGELAAIRFLFALARRGDRREERVLRANAPHPAKRTGPKTGLITGPITGEITGPITGPITGLFGSRPTRQTIDATGQFGICAGDVETNAISRAANGVNGAHANGSSRNGSHALP